MQAEKVSHIQLLVKEVLHTSFADHVLVDAELPWQVSSDSSGENSTGKLELYAPAYHEACAADHGVELLKSRSEFGFRVLGHVTKNGAAYTV